MSLMDLAAARVKNTQQLAAVKKGDLVVIIEPFSKGEDFIGIVTKVSKNHMHVYHSGMKKTIMWSRCVNCSVSHV